MKRKIWKWFLVGFLLILIDIIVYLALGVGLMAYDDFYAGSEKDYLSWHTMDAFDKKIYVVLMVWNFLNLFGIAFIGYKIFKYLKINWKIRWRGFEIRA